MLDGWLTSASVHSTQLSSAYLAELELLADRSHRRPEM
jgi:hypothetical protein